MSVYQYGQVCEIYFINMVGLKSPFASQLATYKSLVPVCSLPAPIAGHNRPHNVDMRVRGGKEVRGSFRSGPSEQSNEPLDWGSSAFPSYLVSLSGRPFPCQEGLDPSTTQPGSKTRAKWKREDAIWQQIR